MTDSELLDALLDAAAVAAVDVCHAKLGFQVDDKGKHYLELGMAIDGLQERLNKLREVASTARIVLEQLDNGNHDDMWEEEELLRTQLDELDTGVRK